MFATFRRSRAARRPDAHRFRPEGAEALDLRALLSGGLAHAAAVQALAHHPHSPPIRHPHHPAHRNVPHAQAHPTPLVPPPVPVFVAPPPVANVPVVSGVESVVEQQIVDLVNQQRAANGLAPVAVNPQLVQAAQIQAAQMAQLGQMSHDLPGAPLPGLTDRLAYVGYTGGAGENIASWYSDANAVMQAWMNSPEHRANILEPSFTQIGVGVAYYSGSGTPFYCEVFG